MKKFAVLLVAAALAGCASAPRHQVNIIPQKNIVKPAPVVPVVTPAPTQTPNQTVKKRWFSGYKIRLLHR